MGRAHMDPITAKWAEEVATWARKHDFHIKLFCTSSDDPTLQTID